MLTQKWKKVGNRPNIFKKEQNHRRKNAWIWPERGEKIRKKTKKDKEMKNISDIIRE